MNIRTTKQFDKHYKNLRKNEQKRVDKSLILFLTDQYHPLLKNHSLHGKWADNYSINAGGDIRIIFMKQGKEIIILLTIGSHSQLEVTHNCINSF